MVSRKLGPAYARGVGARSAQEHPERGGAVVTVRSGSRTVGGAFDGPCGEFQRGVSLLYPSEGGVYPCCIPCGRWLWVFRGEGDGCWVLVCTGF